MALEMSLTNELLDWSDQPCTKGGKCNVGRPLPIPGHRLTSNAKQFYSTVTTSVEDEFACTETTPSLAAASDEYIWLFPMISPLRALSTK